MNPIQSLIVLLAVFGLSNSAFAKSVDLQLTMKGYNGDGAYVAVYLMDANGRLVQTLAVEGRKKKYQKHLQRVHTFQIFPLYQKVFLQYLKFF